MRLENAMFVLGVALMNLTEDLFFVRPKIKPVLDLRVVTPLRSSSSSASTAGTDS